MTTEHAPAWRRVAAFAPALLLVAVAVWEIVAIARAGSDVAGEAEWQQGAAAVRARHQPGDLIVFAPDWIDPVGRLHLGDLIPIEMAARMDAARYGTIWELSIRGARAVETRGLEPESTAHFGRLTVRRFVRPPVEVVTDFVAAFDRAERKGSARVSLEEVGFAPHRCIRTQPRPGGSVTVTFPAAELGAELVGYVGIADVFTRRDNREPGQLAVTIGGRKLVERAVGVDDGWIRFAVASEPGRAEVIFTASMGAAARDRRICFAAEARR